MMLRPFAVIGLSTLTVTATMASVETGVVPNVPTPNVPTAVGTERAADSIGTTIFELPEIDFDRHPRATRSEHVRPARVYRKKKAEDLVLPMANDGETFVGTGRILVKFRNELLVRATMYPSASVISMGGHDVTPVNDLLVSFDAEIEQLIPHTPSKLGAIERKALLHSNRIQPDLASFTRISFPEATTSDRLLGLAHAMNESPLTEWVTFETPVLPASGGGGGVTPNPATSTPDFTSAPWLTAAIPNVIPNPIPPADAFNFPPYTNQNEVLQTYQIGPYGWDGDPAANPSDPADPQTWFREAKWVGTNGYDFPGMVRLAGQAWRRYGLPPNTTNPAFDVGDGPNAGFFGTLPSPKNVWLAGAEFEIVDLTECENGETAYDCADCYEIVPRNADGSIPVKDAFNPFPEFATDLQNLQIYENIKLCPTGRRTEIGVVDIAAFKNHEEFLYDRYGNLLEVEDRPVVFEDGQTMVLLEDQANELMRSNGSHGTATTGVLVAGNNNFGLTGMTWASRVRFFPSLSSEEGARLAGAIISAVGELDAGSILLLPLQTVQEAGGTNPEIGTFVLPGQAAPAVGFFGDNFSAFEMVGAAAIATPGCQHLSSVTIYSQLIATARDAGLVVVQAAGNGGEECASDPGEDAGGGNGIIVTAASPSQATVLANPGILCGLIGVADCWYYGNTFLAEPDDDNPIDVTWNGQWPAAGQTRWSGSNFFNPDSEANILGNTVSGWGMGIPTLGYGDMYRDQNPPEIPDPSEVDPLERDFLRSYTGPRPFAETGPLLPDPYLPTNGPVTPSPYEFGDVGNFGAPFNHNGLTFQGTSCAATQIAGLAAWIQGFGLTFYDTILSDSQILSAMGVGGFVNVGELQPNGFGNEPTGFGGGTPAAGLNNTAVDSTAALIPPVPNGPRAVIGVLTQIGQNFNGDIEIYYGTRVRGNRFSLSEAGDGNRLVIRSEPAVLGQQNEGMTYIFTGETIDFGVVFESSADAEDIITLELEVAHRATSPTVFEIPYVWNNTFERYQALGIENVPIAGAVANYNVAAAGSPDIAAFINDQNEVDVRLYTIGFGFVGSTSFNVEYDEIELLVNQDNGPL